MGDAHASRTGLRLLFLFLFLFLLWPSSTGRIPLGMEARCHRFGVREFGYTRWHTVSSSSFFSFSPLSRSCPLVRPLLFFPIDTGCDVEAPFPDFAL